MLELVHLSESSRRGGGVGQTHGIGSTEAVPPPPTGPRHRLLEILGQSVDLPAQVEILEQRLGQGLELGSLLG